MIPAKQELEPAFEERDGFIGSPAVAAFEEVEVQAIRQAGGLVDFFEFVVATHGRVDEEAVVVDADFDEEWSWRDEAVEVGDVTESEEVGGEL